MLCRPRQPRRSAAAYALLAFLAAAAPSTSPASLSARELHVLTQALPFAHLPDGATTIAVVYAAGNAASRGDAEHIAAALAGGFTVNGVTMISVVIDTTALLATRPAVIITALGANSDAVGRIARTQHALCVTGDLAAVESGICMMTIRSDPRIEIVLNAAAAAAAGVTFPIAFHMMVREL